MAGEATITVNASAPATTEATLTVEDAGAAEGQPLAFTVTLVDGAVPEAFTVTIGYEDGTATAGTDYTATAHVLDFAGTENESHGFTVATVDDAVVEGEETFTVTLTASDERLDDADTATATLTDDDEAAYAVTVEPAAIAEAGGESTVTVSTGEVTFPEAQTFTLTLGGTAAKDTDYTIGSQSLTLAVGESAVTTTVTALDDALDDDAETVVVTARLDGEVIGTAQTITIDDDDAAPAVVSIERHDGTDALAERTNADTLRFRVTFSADVENVDAADFAATGTTGDASAVTGSGAEYIVTVQGGDLDEYDGEVGLAFASAQDIADTAGNALVATLPGGASYQTYLVDNTAPAVVSVERDDGTGTGTDPGEHTRADSIQFRVTFSEAVDRAGAADFDATGTTGNPHSPAHRTQRALNLTVSGGNLGRYEGEVALVINTTHLNIVDKSGNALATTLPGGASYETYTIDRTAPTVTLTPAAGHDGAAAFDVGVAFSEDVSDFDAADDVTVGGGALTDGANSITRTDARTYTVNITPTPGSTSSVTVQVPADAAADAAGNGNDASASETVGYIAPLALATPANRTWTVNTDVGTVALPEATGGLAPFAYALTGTLPAGLTFDPEARPPTITGTPEAAAPAATLTYAVTDAREVHGVGAVQRHRGERRQHRADGALGGAHHAGRGAHRRGHPGVDDDVQRAGDADRPALHHRPHPLRDHRDEGGLGQRPRCVVDPDRERRPAAGGGPRRPVGAGAERCHGHCRRGRPHARRRAAGRRRDLPARQHRADADAHRGAADPRRQRDPGGDHRLRRAGQRLHRRRRRRERRHEERLQRHRRRFELHGDGDAERRCRVHGVGGAGAATDVLGNTSLAASALTVSHVDPLSLGQPDDLVLTQTPSGFAAPVTLPPATGGRAPYTYGLAFGTINLATLGTGDGGTAFDPDTRVLRYPVNNPTALSGTVTYTVTDADGRSDSKTFLVTINPAPAVNAPADQSWRQNEAITALTLEAATGGTAPFTYALENLPAGLSFDPDTRELSGTPTGSTTSPVPITYRATDANEVAATDIFMASVVETVAPTVVSVERHDGTSAQAERTNADSVKFRVTFSEDVENVDTADFDASGAGDATGVEAVSGDAAQYIVTVSGSGLSGYNAMVGLTFAPGQDIEDLAGNDLDATLPAGTSYERYTLDNTAPTVALARSDGLGTTLAGAFDVTVTFTEANGLRTTGDGAFTADALDVTNGGATVEATADPLVWTAQVTPTAGFTGNVQVALPEDRVRDVAGNGNTAATPLTVPVDTAAPTVVSVERSSPTAERTNADTLAWTVTFSEPVTVASGAFGLPPALTGATVTATATDPSPAAAWTVQASGGTALSGHNGDVALVLVNASQISDAAGNALAGTLPSNAEGYTLDNTAPTPTLGAPSLHHGVGTFEVTVDFDEAVNGFAEEDIVVREGTKSSFTGADGASSYTVTVTPGGNADVTVSVGGERGHRPRGQRERRGAGP